MDCATCKAALELAAKYMTPAKYAAYAKALRSIYLQAEIDRISGLLARKVIPVQEFKALNASLPILQQQLAAL